MATVLTWLRRLLFAAATACLALFAALLLYEHSGLLTRTVLRRLARELEPLGPRLTLERARLNWFEPGLVLEGLALAPTEPAGTSDLALERVHLTFSPRFDELRGVSIEQGSVLLGPRLFEDWNRLAGSRAARPPGGAPARLPQASLRGLRVALELFDHTPFELGTLDLCARPGGAEAFELAGSLRPSLGGALSSTEPIRVNGALSPERARLWASARGLALQTLALPPGALARPLPLVEGSARLTLDSSFELVFAEAARPRGRLRASLSEGSLLFRPGQPRLEQLGCELEAELAPEPGTTAWSRKAWDARASLHARAGPTPLWLWAEFGRNVPQEAWLRAWGRASAVPLERQALEAWNLERHVQFVRAMLAPRGQLELAGTLLLGRAADAWTHDLALQARARGDFGLTYQGHPADPGSGVAIPVSGAQGQCVVGLRSEAASPWRLAAFDLSAEHGSGRIEGWTQVTAPERDSGFPLPLLDLVLSTPSLAIDATLEQALADNRHLDWIAPAFAPLGGTLAGELRLRTGPEVAGTSAEVDLRLRGTALRWSEVPVPMEGVSGEVSVRWSAELAHARGRPELTRRPFGVSYLFDNRGGPRVGAQARVAGWVREEAFAPEFDPAVPPPEPLQEIRVDIDELGLRGRDFDVLASRFPALGREVADYGAVGRMHVRFRGAQPGAEQPFASWIEATPLEVHARPQFFQRQTRDLRGRILIQSEERDGAQSDASQLVLAGTWPGDVELLVDGTIPARGEARVRVLGGGIDPTNVSFKGALITTLASSGPSTQGIDLSGWTLAGAVDFALETSFDPASTAPAVNRYRIHLRDNELRSDALHLRDLYGTLEQLDEELSSPLVRATLGGHPLELRDVRTFPLAALARIEQADPWLTREGFWTDAGGRALQADLYTRGLPLDAEHMEGLLEPDALAVLRATPSWRGALDVLGARLVVTREADNQGRVALRGPLRPHDLALRLGLPIRIATASLELEELVLESGRFRGWARISGLQARIAERELSDARMIAGYVDGRLTIDNLSGDFEGGRLESLGGALGSASKALGVDLSEPYRFDVGLRLEDVDVAGLLRGVFQSSIADEGVLDASLQLSGTPDEILELTGRGSLSLDEGALWSIPVMRELFQQLGFDKTGLFDRLRSRFELRAGRIQVSHLEIQSDLLDLVGAGWQDLDGELSYDLEVRYGLLDKLGPLSRLLYWLNNSLWRVAVRGDFDRPEVTIRNSILELVRGFDEHPPRRLPLPPFAPLGPRF